MLIVIMSDKLSVIVPYRDRESQLLESMPNLAKFLNHYDIDHTITVVNQSGVGQFNRGKLKNVGFLETKDSTNYSVLHDVDIYPVLNEHSSNDFGYFETPNYFYPRSDDSPVDWALHICKPSQKCAGCIFKVTNEHFESVNGFSNNYWGWGYEDRDLYDRLCAAGVTIHNQGKRVSKYGRAKFVTLDGGTGWDGDHVTNNDVNAGIYTASCSPEVRNSDGLNTCLYKVLSTTRLEYYTVVDVLV